MVHNSSFDIRSPRLSRTFSFSDATTPIGAHTKDQSPMGSGELHGPVEEILGVQIQPLREIHM
jgi:hypothetical protein